MFLSVDIGNTTIQLGLHDGQRWRKVFKYSSVSVQPDIFYLKGLQEVFLEWRVHPTEVLGVGLSSVVPELTAILEDILYQVTRKRATVLGPEIYMLLPMEVPLPYEIGSDIVANAFAALKKNITPAIIVDFGTALTFTIVHDKGIYGVSIAPGINTAFKSLSVNTAQLPEARADLPDKVIGSNTQHAIQSGILYGYSGLVKELIALMRVETGLPYTVIATGGQAALLPLTGTIDRIKKRLTLDGIRLISQHIQNKSN